MGKVSPGSTPARESSAFAVMVLSVTEGVALRPSLFCPLVLADELGSLTTLKLWLLLLGRLDELTLLGEGLNGGLPSTEGYQQRMCRVLRLRRNWLILLLRVILNVLRSAPM
jgi:hypothetical protein